ncbi:hypothetical protein IGI04_034657 [Brassica rapa subsp. trilocularis]|uniref:GDSL esterase/lipase n=1 Tax=Brassica rapa subsp. trilocularis TaxID=1813537 RepID=A0ABQ7LAE1_BRACM|nr:hypothetical protein IGI04_034657 [Brassica rapa subsp. trilocularis]
MATLLPHSDSFSFFFVIFISLAVLSHRHPSATAAAGCQAPPVIFNFGDSNSDTGGLVAGLGYLVGLPNGRSFFRRSTGRLCDGRLLIDFLSQSETRRRKVDSHVHVFDRPAINGHVSRQESTFFLRKPAKRHDVSTARQTLDETVKPNSHRKAHADKSSKTGGSARSTT